MKLELIMRISAGLRENIAAWRGFIGQQYFPIYLLGWETLVIKKDKGNFNRTGRWRFYTEDGRTMVVSYEDKDYQKGIFIMEGFPANGDYDKYAYQ
ncbi:hypothetical protein [Prevotella fusca]